MNMPHDPGVIVHISADGRRHLADEQWRGQWTPVTAAIFLGMALGFLAAFWILWLLGA